LKEPMEKRGNGLTSTIDYGMMWFLADVE
jgi:hypothetical protein